MKTIFFYFISPRGESVLMLYNIGHKLRPGWTLIEVTCWNHTYEIPLFHPLDKIPPRVERGTISKGFSRFSVHFNLARISRSVEISCTLPQWCFLMICIHPPSLNDIFYHDNIKLQGQTNYKLYEMKKSKTRLNRTQNLLKVSYRLK